MGKLKDLPELAERCLKLRPQVLELADNILAKRESLFKEGQGGSTVRGPNNSMFVLGRGFQLAAANETALKIQEISYIHATGKISLNCLLGTKYDYLITFIGLCASELKHGPLALVQGDMPVILFIMQDRFKDVRSHFMHAEKTGN